MSMPRARRSSPVRGGSAGTREVSQLSRSRRIPVAQAPAAIASGDGDLWVTNNLDDTVTRIDARTLRAIETIPVGQGPVGVTYGYDAGWGAANEDRTVNRIDPTKDQVVETIPLGRRPRAAAAGDHGVWVTNDRDDTVSRDRPRPNEVVETIRVGAGPARHRLRQRRRLVREQPRPDGHPDRA
jgi:YVTN family beta-propeller protein